MANKSSYLKIIDLRSLAKTSRLRYGALETRGVPAILLGAAAVVFTAGASKMLQHAATVLPETLREARLFWTTVRPARPELRDDFSNANVR